MVDDKASKPVDSSERRRYRKPPHHAYKKVRMIVKGYMRPDGSSYHVVIPKQIREMMELRGGEYFLMKASPIRDEISLKKVEVFEEEE